MRINDDVRMLTKEYDELIACYREVVEEEKRKGMFSDNPFYCQDDYADSCQRIDIINKSIYDIERSISIIRSNLGD